MANDTMRHGWRALRLAVTHLPLHAILLLVRAYRLILSPLLGAHCRFQPTCSAYALEAIERHGLIRGGALAIKRLARCHPIAWLGGDHGFDPVPHGASAKAHHRDV